MPALCEAYRYLREFEPLGTGGGLYHFREQILRTRPSSVFVLHSDVCCDFPLHALLSAHQGRAATILAVRVGKEEAMSFGCIGIDEGSGRVEHYVDKPHSFVSDTVSSGIYVFGAEVFEEIGHVVRQKTDEMYPPLWNCQR